MELRLYYLTTLDNFVYYALKYMYLWEVQANSYSIFITGENESSMNVLGEGEYVVEAILKEKKVNYNYNTYFLNREQAVICNSLLYVTLCYI